MPSSEVMKKWGKGQLHSGSKSGPKVKNQKQAIAIMLSEKRKEQAGGSYEDNSAQSRGAKHAHIMRAYHKRGRSG